MTRNVIPILARILAGPIAILCATGPACAAGLFPLEAGRIWEFADGASRVVIESSLEGDGLRATTEEADFTGVETLWFWHVDVGGSTWLTGYEDSTDRFAFVPALLWVPADLEKGQVWGNRSTVLNSAGKPVRDVVQQWTAAGLESIALPWGTVEAMRVELYGERLAARRLLRDDTDPGDRPWVNYYVQDMGIVRRGRDDLIWIDVERFGTDFVPAGSLSLGRWKGRHADAQ